MALFYDLPISQLGSLGRLMNQREINQIFLAAEYWYKSMSEYFGILVTDVGLRNARRNAMRGAIRKRWRTAIINCNFNWIWAD